MDPPVQYCSSQYDPLPPQEGHCHPEPSDVSVAEVFVQNPDLKVSLQEERDNRQNGDENFEGESHFFVLLQRQFNLRTGNVQGKSKSFIPRLRDTASFLPLATGAQPGNQNLQNPVDLTNSPSVPPPSLSIKVSLSIFYHISAMQKLSLRYKRQAIRDKI